MAIFAPIPLPSIDNHQFKDVMDFWEQLQERKAKQPLLAAEARKANAAASREEELAKLPFAGKEMPGAAGRAMALMMVKARFGENSPEFQEAKKLYDLEMNRAEQTMAYQQSLMESQGKRYASPQGKLAQEQVEIDRGQMPGSTVGGKPGTTLTPDQQEKLKGQFSLKQLKDTTDPNLRQRILFSKNMDITLDNLPVDDLVAYSGLKGTQELINDSIAANVRGEISPKYKKYNEAMTAARALAKQIRQFYGDSITPSVQRGLDELTNPTTWLKHPDIAKAQFNRFKKIVKTEEKTFLNAAKSAKIFEEEPESNELTYNIETGEFE